MEIRAYQARDHDGVVALWRAVFPDAPPRNDPILDIRRKLAVQPELFLVALHRDALVGTCMAGFDGHRGWVHCPKLNLQVRASAPEAVPFYEKLGFQIEERISMGKILLPRTGPGRSGITN